MNTTISGLQKHFADMYGLRNHFVNGSIESRILHLVRRMGRIADARRKEEPMEGCLARAVNYFMSCINYYGDHLDLELGMMEKFPISGCLYCSCLPCNCAEGRPDPTRYTIHEVQRSWKLNQWQEHLKSVYGHFNIGKFEKVFLRFVSEVGEFGILNAEGPHTPIFSEPKLKECRQEAADVLSWILTMAYVKEINLEQAVTERYTACPGCGKISNCECPLVFISKDGQRFSRVGTPDYIKPPL